MEQTASIMDNDIDESAPTEHETLFSIRSRFHGSASSVDSRSLLFGKNSRHESLRIPSIGALEEWKDMNGN